MLFIILLSLGIRQTPINFVPPRDNVSVIKFTSPWREFTTAFNISLPDPIESKTKMLILNSYKSIFIDGKSI